jgi:hypothetical protein
MASRSPDFGRKAAVIIGQSVLYGGKSTTNLQPPVNVHATDCHWLKDAPQRGLTHFMAHAVPISFFPLICDVFFGAEQLELSTARTPASSPMP